MKSFTAYLVTLAILSDTIEADDYWRTGSDGRQYYINNDQVFNWYEALHTCQRQNQQLVEINSEAKNNIIIQILRPLLPSVPNLWIGAHDENNENIDVNRPFYWSTSGKLMTFSHWGTINPDNAAGKEHCAHIWSETSTYEWNDNKCEAQMGFICEDNHISIEKCQELQSKRKEIARISADISANNQQCQKQQTENLEKGFNCFKQVENQLGEVLVQLQTKLETDIKRLIMRNINVTLTAVDKRNTFIQNIEVDIKKAADKLNKECAEELQSSHESIDSILEC